MQTYPAKLLLLGEYSIILGSEALAIPLPTYSGHWAKAKQLVTATSLQQNLPEFCTYLYELASKQQLLWEIDIEQFQEDLNKGCYFESNVPQGYGLGSSGVLCAGIYAAYAKNKTQDASLLKEIFAQMESFFHGSSSGTDPLVCYINKSIHIVENKVNSIQLKENLASNAGYLILDTQLPRNTDPLVRSFIEKSKIEKFKTLCEEKLNPAVSAAILATKTSNHKTIYAQIEIISKFQEEHFQKMIPEAFQFLWKTGKKKGFLPKICGAGGGGFILLYTNNIEQVLQEFKAYQVQVVFRV